METTRTIRRENYDRTKESHNLQDDKEVWVNVIGYEKIYELSMSGKVIAKERYIDSKKFINGKHSKGFRKSKLLKSQLSYAGYVRVFLTKGGKKKAFTIHRLLALHFIPNPENKPCINHINGIKSDNRLENLEWVTNSENDLHAYRLELRKPMKGVSNGMAKLNDNKVRKIRGFLSKGLMHKDIAKKFNVAPVSITRIANNQLWRHVV